MPVEDDKLNKPRSRSRSRSPIKGGEERRGRSAERKRSPGRRSPSSTTSSSRTESKEGRRKGQPGRDTNSNDPNAIRRRVFVGNLNTDKVTRDEVEEHFSQYGKIVACSLHMNFGFVEFATEKEADEAVAKTHGTTLFGKRVDCNIASERRRPQGKDKGGPPRRGSPPGRRGDRSRSPHRYRRSPSPMSRYDELYRRDDPLGRFGDDRYDAPRPYGDYRDDSMYNRDPYARRDDPLAARDPYARDYGPPLDRRYDDLAPSAPRRTTDCEIIVTSRDIRAYGESIETRLRAMGIISNLVFPPPDIPVVDVMDRIGKSGCLYTVLVNPQNEYHRSCTLNILHGTPQEHRNMPLDDALAFVARNFDQYLKDVRERGAAFRNPPPPSAAYREDSFPKSSLVQDSYVAKLLDIAVSGKPLKVPEINHLIEALIKYKREIEPPEETASTSQPASRVEADREPASRPEAAGRLEPASYSSPSHPSTTTSWSTEYAYGKRDTAPPANSAAVAASTYVKAAAQQSVPSKPLTAAAERAPASYYDAYGAGATSAGVSAYGATAYSAYGANNVAQVSSQSGVQSASVAQYSAAYGANYYAAATQASAQQPYYYDTASTGSAYPYGS